MVEVRTFSRHGYRTESIGGGYTVRMKQPAHDARALMHKAPPEATDPALDALVTEIIGRVADKWTMLALEALQEHGRLRFTEVAHELKGVSQKMLTKTLRQMESDGLLLRTVFPVIPPRVEYELTPLGASLSEAFCGVWIWAEKYREDIQAARARFAQRIEHTQPWQTPRS
jgi:DNA-binding HxlR family transcriptional regulator